MLDIGAHMSIAGGIHLSFQRSAEIGANTLQIFAKSPRGRAIPHYDEQEYKDSLTQRKSFHQQGGLIHSNYLANLSKPFDECKNDINSILHDFEVAQKTGFNAVNVHIGKGKGMSNRDEAFKNMTKNLEYILKHNKNHGYTAQFLFEITAGQGSELGSNLEELSYFYQNFLKDLPIKFCFDTAHAWGGGIDLTQWNKIIEEWDQKIGTENLFSFHLNDSKVILGSHLDRHASLGKGFIGRPTLAPIIQRASNHHKTVFLETPDPEIRPDEITMVKKIADGDTDRVEEFHQKHFRTDVLKKFEGERGLF